MNFNVDKDEWHRFWNWISRNTGAHHIGPLVTVTSLSRNKKLEEISMNFFLTHKNMILNNPPECTCGSNVLVGHHKNNCPKDKFHRLALSVRT